jgi:2-polyprenyl-6-methoxyphenol hydroxylase-like FAD-dependent oxidoreductase
MPRSADQGEGTVRILIVGAGPAGLYAAIRLRQARPDAAIRVVEQNPPDATFGFGVVLSDEALGFLAADDPATVALIEPHLTRWRDIHIHHRGTRVVLDGIGFSGIGRLDLLRLLQGRAAELGIVPEYRTRLEVLPEADLIVGADGLNSVVRRQGDFGATLSHQQNRFIWYGTPRNFPALTQTFITTGFGPMNAHHYSYAPGRSTFIIEMGPETFARTGFDRMPEPESRAVCERLFAAALDGAPLIANNPVWRQFPNLWCDRWHDGNRVLVGDALHTAHFSIGSGTRLALEDVVALVRALQAHDWDLAAALPAYQAAREPVLRKLVAAARASADWYDQFGTHMALEPMAFALAYIRRAGRIDGPRLRALCPDFAARAAALGLLDAA